jgi:hypothetical protein
MRLTDVVHFVASLVTYVAAHPVLRDRYHVVHLDESCAVVAELPWELRSFDRQPF